jgi:filamentous hemagglutinin family protein
LPTGAQVAAGQASIGQNGKQMTINQGSDRAVINWQGFDIGSQAAVRFNQPGTSSVALNRVVAGDASQIHGQLSANGQLWVLNPNGVVFGAGSRVDVGGLVASTMHSSDADFMAGKAVFHRNGSTGSVLNQGRSPPMAMAARAAWWPCWPHREKRGHHPRPAGQRGAGRGRSSRSAPAWAAGCRWRQTRPP